MSTVTNVASLMIEHSCDLGKFKRLLYDYISGMIVGPCVGYMIQSYKMTKEKNADGFSPLVCLILLVANILRVYWW